MSRYLSLAKRIKLKQCIQSLTEITVEMVKVIKGRKLVLERNALEHISELTKNIVCPLLK
jgi:hypothetical protein